MRDFSVCPPKEGAQALVSALERLTLIRDDAGPLDELKRFALALYEGDMPLVERYYHSLTRALIQSPARRVSGDLFKDHLISLVLQRDNAFSDMAASGRTDKLVCSLYKNDLIILGSLMPLGSRDLIRMAGERLREVRRLPGHADNASRLSAELWSGAKLPPVEQDKPKQNTAGLEPIDFEWTGWSYGGGAAADSYIADEVLEEVYPRLLLGSWPELEESLRDLFSIYGSGDFLRWRLMSFGANGLAPLPDGAAAPLIGSLYEIQRGVLQDNVIRFMRGESAANMLITGPGGTGKTASVYALAYELPEVRLIRLRRGADVQGLMRRLMNQPVKFLLLLDDIQPDDPRIRHTVASLCAGFAQPANVLLCGTAREGENSLLPLNIELPYLTIAEFTDTVIRMVSMDTPDFDAMRIRALCVDHQVDCRDRLTYSGAVRVASEYKLMQ